jgi:hypothetical protein
MALALIPKSKRAKAALATATGHWDAGRKAQGGWEGGWRLEEGGRQVGINYEYNSRLCEQEQKRCLSALRVCNYLRRSAFIVSQ